MREPLESNISFPFKSKSLVNIIPATVIDEFAELANKYKIMLVIDETYRVFSSSDGPPHNLFNRLYWDDAIVSLHSFSKEFAIPGHRVGAAIGNPDLITEMMKLFDCVAICAPRLGQEAVIAGLLKAKKWRQEKILKMQEKKELFDSIFHDQPGGFELCASGAFYGWVRHPFIDKSTDIVVQRLLYDKGVFVLPGTIFTQNDNRFLRFSFCNLSIKEIKELRERLI